MRPFDDDSEGYCYGLREGMGVQEETMSSSFSGSPLPYRQGAEENPRGDLRGHPGVDSGTKRARSRPPEPWTRGSRVPCDGGQYSLQKEWRKKKRKEGRLCIEESLAILSYTVLN